MPRFGHMTGAAKYSPEPVGVVGASTEFRRILALPRRLPEWNDETAEVESVTRYFRRPGGAMRLRPVQAAALLEAADENGLFAPIGVGQGKELICLLLPEVMDSKKTVLLIPPELRGQVTRDMARYSEHFNLPLDRITVVAYSELSLAKNTDLLERLCPDLLIGNEAHHLKRRQSARTKRLLRFAKKHPECRHAYLSGTAASRSIRDCSHLLELTLRKNSPAPVGWQETQDWAGALDVKPVYAMRPGALLQFCAEGETPRAGYGRRLSETKGVVSTRKNELATSLVIRKVGVRIPDPVFSMLEQVRKDWVIGEDEIADAMIRAEILRQVACGFYYRWDWPGGVPDFEWLEARSKWNRAVREKLKQGREGMDSPLLCYRAAERWHRGEREGLVWDCDAWPAWREVEDRPEPPKVTILISDYLCLDAIRRAAEHVKGGARTIIWYEHVAVGEKLSKLAGLPRYGPGANKDAGLATADIIVCSRSSQGTGKNLQHRYSANIFTMLGNGEEMEQAIGRTHRDGQEADEVWVDWYGHTPELESLMDKAKAEARFQEELLQQPQKLLYAAHV